jgi:hypothetical protein
VRAFDSVDAARREVLERELVALWADHNHADGAATRVESEYLEVIALR